MTNNDSISKLYIFYQMIVILFSMLGPAIIFTMMVFAQVAAFRLDSLTVLLCNLIPVMMFIVVCFVASSKAQVLIEGLAFHHAMLTRLFLSLVNTCEVSQHHLRLCHDGCTSWYWNSDC